MRSRATSPTSTIERGFSLVELLLTILVASVGLAAAVTYSAYESTQTRQSSLRVEAQQALRASLDAMARDIKLAGACLPTGGPFVALDGANGPPDAITIVSGVVQGTASCTYGGATAPISPGSTVLSIDNVTGFAPGQLVYITGAGSGEIVNGVTAVTTGIAPAGTITLSTGVVGTYPVSAGIYAVDERVYWVDQTNPALPKLTLTVNRQAPEAFAAGMTNLQIQYVLNRSCPTCDVIGAPPLVAGAKDSATWWLVNDVILTATVQTIGASPQEAAEATLVETTDAKPRNLLQPGAS